MADKAQLEQEIGSWIAVLGAVTPNTAATYRSAVRSALERLLASGLDPVVASSCVASLATSGLKPNSIADRSQPPARSSSIAKAWLADRHAVNCSSALGPRPPENELPPWLRWRLERLGRPTISASDWQAQRERETRVRNGLAGLPIAS